MAKKCKNARKNCAKLGGGVPGMTTWYYRGVDQMTMFDHEGGGGVKISENLTTWYMKYDFSNFIAFLLCVNFARRLYNEIDSHFCS